MQSSYKTISRASSETLVIKKSKFIGQAAPVSSEEEASAFLNRIRKECWDATHNCFAYVIGERAEIQKASDDGEPSGTAGRPILDVILKEELRNVIVVVTRYYGGILLGAGGLVRAYSQSAHDALHAAGICTRSLFRKVVLTFDYSWIGPIQHELQNLNAYPEPAEYADKVTLSIRVPDEDTDSFVARMVDLTNGQIETAILELDYATVSADGKLIL